MSEQFRGLRAIRFVIYGVTIFYALINTLSQSTRDATVGATEVNGFILLAAGVGIMQFMAAIFGVLSEFISPKGGGLRKASLLFLSLTFLYEFVYSALSGSTAFIWAPLMAYSLICAVLYLSEG